MIEIDGNNGGGQMVRYALAASASTGISFAIDHVRGNRPEGGLKPQHVNAIETVADLCQASTDGVEEGSTAFRFEPGDIDTHNIRVDIGTAGSIPLLFQTLLPLSYHTDDSFQVRVEGGTDVKWSPPIDYMAHVTTNIASLFGCVIDIKTSRRGFYPKGGGIAGITVQPGKPETVFLDDPGSVKTIRGWSLATHQLKDSSVAERQRSEVRRVLRNVFPSSVDLDIETKYVQSRSPGSSLTLAAETAESYLGADALGERGKQSEEVGNEAAQQLVDALQSGAAVDPHMADQVIPFLAEAGGQVCVPERTDHLETAVSLLNRFYDRKITVSEEGDTVLVITD